MYKVLLGELHWGEVLEIAQRAISSQIYQIVVALSSYVIYPISMTMSNFSWWGILLFDNMLVNLGIYIYRCSESLATSKYIIYSNIDVLADDNFSASTYLTHDSSLGFTLKDIIGPRIAEDTPSRDIYIT